ncbi:phosphate regulon sensor histidine kinase PhoR [Marinicella sp. S1101]|uniref:phosphate regulon sensor histidine kinase PhoR n=1 Tax=Marinicella marina TaxID=2996016 RepID=UPI002260E8BA|nr:phosphate regulon sensor histidine kinase PhoR [Marinicella marina]MCX7553098.1 phosphate regulon sensor histidine kinase PhoR [Marinicella marina]MDJ1138830.1 phosphate regulon sensor histidine kinase PhoR [Marinicella marina]
MLILGAAVGYDCDIWINSHNKAKLMQVTGWKQEQVAVLVFVILAVITGALSGYWAAGFLLWLLIYMVWKFFEFRNFYDWYMGGASRYKTPENHGVFEALTCQVINNKNQTKETQKRNKYLLKQFVTTAQALPFATLLLNQRFEIQWCNHIAQEILGITDKDANTKIDNIIREPEFVELLNTIKKDEETKLPHFKDREKSIQVRLIKIHKDRYLMVARDISAQEALQKSRKAFVANASHELRTPLTVISGYLEMLQTAENMTEEWSGAIDQAKEQAGRMSIIINDMLKLSRIEHDKVIPSQDTEVPMPELLNGLFNDIKNGANSQNHVMAAEIDSALYVRGDASEITSICLNLMHNALIHTPKGTSIKVRWFEHNGEANYWVVDDGPGIDAKHLPHLTERFYRVDNSKATNHQSTGLGLAIVKHICLKHSAHFEIDSTLGKGATFKVIFPKHRTHIDA